MPVISKENNELVAMLSQSTLLEYLVNNKEKLGNQIHQSIRELNVGGWNTAKKVIQATEDMILLKVMIGTHNDNIDQLL